MGDERCINCENYILMKHICKLDNKAKFKTSFCKNHKRRGSN